MALWLKWKEITNVGIPIHNIEGTAFKIIKTVFAKIIVPIPAQRRTKASDKILFGPCPRCTNCMRASIVRDSDYIII